MWLVVSAHSLTRITYRSRRTKRVRARERGRSTNTHGAGSPAHNISRRVGAAVAVALLHALRLSPNDKRAQELLSRLCPG